MNLPANLKHTWSRDGYKKESESLHQFRRYASYFIPATQTESAWFEVLSSGMYYPYKCYWYIRPTLIKCRTALGKSVRCVIGRRKGSE